MESQISDWGQAMMASLTSALALFFNAVPKLIGFAIIVIVGWMVASLAERGVVALLRMVKFNELALRSGFSDFVKKSGTEGDSSGMIAGIVKWFVRLIALVVAFDALGLPAVSEVLRQLLLWLPNLVVALVVLVVGGLAASVLAKLVRGATAEAGFEKPEFFARISSIAVWAFAIVIAVNQIGVATTLVNTLFTAVVGALALALGLAFGLGGRETAGEILRGWYQTMKAKSMQIESNADNPTGLARRKTDVLVGKSS